MDAVDLAYPRAGHGDDVGAEDHDEDAAAADDPVDDVGRDGRVEHALEEPRSFCHLSCTAKQCTRQQDK